MRIWSSPMMFALLLSLMAADAAPGAPETIVTTTGQRYEKAEITSHTPAAITVAYDAGVATLPFTELSVEMQKRFGYDPVAAKAWLAKVAEAQRLAAQQLAEEREARKRQGPPSSPGIGVTESLLRGFERSGWGR